MTNEATETKLNADVAGQVEPLVMNADLEYREVIWWEQNPDIYDGENCDEVRPRWYGYADGDKEGGFDEKIELTPDRFPPGTLVKVMIPCCPKCGVDADMHKHGNCDFDWQLWTECKYS